MMVPCRARGLHRLLGDERRRLGQRAEDAAGVEPARAHAAEDLVPVDVARLELRDRRVAAIGAAERRADAEAALGEVEAIAHRAADAVVLDPRHALVDAALKHQVFDEAADGVVGERSDDGGVQAEAALSARARRCTRRRPPRRWNARAVWMRHVARVEPQHDFAQRHAVPATGSSIAGSQRNGRSVQVGHGSERLQQVGQVDRPDWRSRRANLMHADLRPVAPRDPLDEGSDRPPRAAPRPGPCARSACEPRQGRKAAALSRP